MAEKEVELKYVILRPLGYPLKASFVEYPKVDNPGFSTPMQRISGEGNSFTRES